MFTELAEALTQASSGSISIDMLKNEKQDPREWFAYFDRCAIGNGWISKVKGAKVPQYLRGEAEYIWKQMKKSKQYDYDSVKRKLIKKLQPENRSLDATNKFFNSIQNESETVEEFSRRLKKLAKLSGKISKKDIISRMRQTMHKEIALATVTVNSKSFTKFVKKCKAAEKYTRFKETENINAITNNFKGKVNFSERKIDSDRTGNVNTKHQFYTNKSNNNTVTFNKQQNTNQPNQFQSQQTASDQVRRCYKCNDPNHYRNECPIWKEQMQQFVCYRCNGRGHTQKYCQAK